MPQHELSISSGCAPGMSRSTASTELAAPNAFWWQWACTSKGAGAALNCRGNGPALPSRAPNASQGEQTGRFDADDPDPRAGKGQQRINEFARLDFGALNHAAAQVRAAAAIVAAILGYRAQGVAGRAQHAGRGQGVFALECAVERIDKQKSGAPAASRRGKHLLSARQQLQIGRPPEGV